MAPARADSIAFIRFLCAQAIGEDWLVRELGKRLDESVAASGARELGLLLWMNTLGMQRDATPRMRRLLGRLPGEEIAKLSKPVMRLFYPMPYLAETKPLLVHDSILDASFVHAVMRQESGYDRFAKSGAGAIGLLQLMPPTARAMAKKAGVPGFRTDMLTDPVVNLRLGITYLRDLTRVWKGQLPLVLANYNAGPSPTMRWMDAFLNLPVEQAAEEITYWETRDYVKKCMGNYWTYRLLYPESR
jgi:soluble lytic murein transglycosylase